MKEWRRVPTDTLCGLCGATIRAEFPAQFIILPTVKRERVRCPSCAGELPPDLPERYMPSNTITPTKKSRGGFRMSRFEAPPDYTSRLLGERDE